MNRYVHRGFGVLGAAMLVLGSLPTPALAQPVAPDLELKLIGRSAKDERVLYFEVNNVGREWTDATSVTIEFLRGGTKVHEQQFAVPDLNPKGLNVPGTANSFPFSYMLPAGQDAPGFTVRGTLKPGVSSRGNGFLPETNLENNVVSYKASGKVNTPPAAAEHLQVGMHVENFQPKFFASRSRQNSGGICAPFNRAGNPTAGFVGWEQREQNCTLPAVGQGWHTEIAQTGVAFDLSKLDEITNLRIKSAKLKFTEEQASWLTGDEKPRPVATCVASVALATRSLAEVPGGTLFPNAPRKTPRPPTKMTTVWDLELDVRHAALNERGSPTRYSYVIKGEEPNLTGDDNAACSSMLSGIHLEVEYETLP